MTSIAKAIKALPLVAQQTHEPISEEPVFILTSSQLQEIITRAIQPLQDEVLQLKVTVAQQGEDIASLKSTERLNFDDIRDLYTAIGEIEQRQQNKGPTVQPQPKGSKTNARITTLKTALKARGGGMTFKEAEKLLGIKRNQMTKLVSQLDKRSFEIFARAGSKREKIIRLKSFA